MVLKHHKNFVAIVGAQLSNYVASWEGRGLAWKPLVQSPIYNMQSGNLVNVYSVFVML